MFEKNLNKGFLVLSLIALISLSAVFPVLPVFLLFIPILYILNREISKPAPQPVRVKADSHAYQYRRINRGPPA